MMGGVDSTRPQTESLAGQKERGQGSSTPDSPIAYDKCEVTKIVMMDKEEPLGHSGIRMPLR